jgi:hypothetical protein
VEDDGVHVFAFSLKSLGKGAGRKRRKGERKGGQRNLPDGQDFMDEGKTDALKLDGRFGVCQKLLNDRILLEIRKKIWQILEHKKIGGKMPENNPKKYKKLGSQISEKNSKKIEN